MQKKGENQMEAGMLWGLPGGRVSGVLQLWALGSTRPFSMRRLPEGGCPSMEPSELQSSRP